MMRGLLNSSRNKKFIYALLGFSFALSIFVFVLLSKTRDDLNKTKEQADSDRGTINIRPLTFSQEIENKSKFILSADKANFFQNKGKGILKNFTITYIYNGGKKLTISGMKAVLNINSSSDLSSNISLANIYSKEKVNIVSSDGYRFETRKLFWDGSKRVITTEEPIIFYGKNFRITGEGLRADVDEEKVEIRRKVDVIGTAKAVSEITSED